MSEVPLIEIHSDTVRNIDDVENHPLRSLGIAVDSEIAPVDETLQDKDKITAADKHAPEDYRQRQRERLFKQILNHPPVYSDLQPDFIGGAHVQLIKLPARAANKGWDGGPNEFLEPELSDERVSNSLHPLSKLAEKDDTLGDFVTRNIPKLRLSNVLIPFSMPENSARYKPTDLDHFVNEGDFTAELIRLNKAEPRLKSYDKVNKLGKYVNSLFGFFAR